MKFKDDPIIETKKSFGYAYTFTVLGFFCGILLLIFGDINYKYFQLSDAHLGIGIVLIICGIITLFIPFTYNKILFYEDRFFFKRQNKTIYYSEILNLDTSEFKTDSGVIGKLCEITLTDSVFTLSTFTVKNYDVIIEFLKTKDIPSGQKLPYKFRNAFDITNSLLGIIMFAIFIIILSSIIFWDYGMKKSKQNETEKIAITTILNEVPYFDYTEDGDDFIEFYSDELKETFLFCNVIDVGYDSLNYILDSIIANDTIKINISKYDYEIKILKTKTPTFWDKHFEWNKLKLYKLEHHQKTLFDLK